MLGSLLSELRLPCEFSAERWDAGPAKILGENLCHTIEETLLPKSMACVGNEQTPRCRSARRIFRGGKWKEALIIPFFSAPERICAFGFIGRQGDMTKDYVFRCANVNVHARNRPNREAGLAMHPQTQEIAGDWDKCIFAVSDPLLYLDLHLRQFSYSNDAIPLVLWQDSPATTTARTQHAWRQFHDRKIVFWDPAFSVSMVQQAIAINGWIAMVGPRNCDATSLREYCNRHMPSTVCQRLQRNARPWPTALASVMLHWTDSQIEDLILQLDLDAKKLEQIRKACSPGLCDRFNSILRRHDIQGSVNVDGGAVVAQDDCWFFYRHADRQRQLMQICNAQVRIDRVVTYPEPGHDVYSGVVHIQGEDVPFAAPQRAFEANPLRWLQQYLITEHKGLLQYAAKWSNSLIHIASQFHEPVLVPGIVSAGWDNTKLRFVIPGYCIGIDGVELVPDSDVPMPAAGLSLQDTITDVWDNYDDYGSALYWATLGCILDNVMAPALLRDTRGIGLLGLGSKAVGASVAQAAGCVSRTVRGPAQMRTALAFEQQHHWPLYVELPPPKNGFKVRGWLTQSFPRNCIMPVRVSQPDHRRGAC